MKKRNTIAPPLGLFRQGKTAAAALPLEHSCLLLPPRHWCHVKASPPEHRRRSIVAGASSEKHRRRSIVAGTSSKEHRRWSVTDPVSVLFSWSPFPWPSFSSLSRLSFHSVVVLSVIVLVILVVIVIVVVLVILVVFRIVINIVCDYCKYSFNNVFFFFC